jgi:5-aminolevulinate synthase
LELNGIRFISNNTHITPIPIGDEKICKGISDTLLHLHGIYIQPIVFPTVKKGEACLRITISVKHEESHFQSLVEALKKVLLVDAINTGIKKCIK